MWANGSTMVWLLFLCIPLTVVQACYEYSSPIPNPCLEKECPFGAECIPSYDGRSAECVCPAKCVSYGDSRDSRPVCGSDGRDYSSLCELNRHACNLSRTLSVKYSGSCDPCYGVRCPESQICLLDDARNPTCKCNAACGDEFEPVCASDGNTYANECILRVEACKSRKILRILHHGTCAETNCKSLKCPFYQECEVNRYGIAVCQCPAPCSKIMKPVCSTNSESFDSECELKRHACLNRLNITARYYGVCDPSSFCHQNHGICKYGASCLSTNSRKHECICPECTEEFEPVCANDVTYNNLCKLRQSICEQKLTNLTIHEGPCGGCENTSCRFYAHCIAEKPGQCTCPMHCNKISEPVCGTDLVTYLNECHLRQSSCFQRKYIVALKRGPCTSCQDVHCEHGARCENGICVCPRKCPTYHEPVCGDNNVTYNNVCQLMAASCESTSQISVKHKGVCEDPPLSNSISALSQMCLVNACKYDGICVLDHKHNSHCLCRFNCSNVAEHSRQICGSDGRVYQNECLFQEEMCHRQQKIKPMEKIFCEKYRNIPCEGVPPLIKGSTGVEYNCSEESCPTQSYCHRGLDFAKCCRELDPDEDCLDTSFGCCPDEKTSALGPNHAGCPSTCQCNRLGSYLFKCDPITRHCFCKPGVGGLRCDRCEAGYWGLHKISEGNAGCIPCLCNKVGSSRDDCEQMSGRCVCKAAFKGMKCDICANGSPIETGFCALQVENANCTDDSFRSEKCRTVGKNSATTSPVRRSTEYQNYDKFTKRASVESEPLTTRPTVPMQWESKDEQSPFFGNSAFLEMATLQAYSKMSVHIELVPFEPEGVILFNAQTNTGDGDYIALLLKNSFIEYRFNLGSGSVVLRSESKITIGKSVSIDLRRHLSEGFLSIDNHENITGRSEGPHKLLDLGQNLFIGGSPFADVRKITDILGTKKNFTGCIRSLRINDQVVQLSPENSEIMNYVQVERCSRQKCSQSYCHNEGACIQREDQYQCVCVDNFDGPRCQTRSRTCENDECSQENFGRSYEALDFWSNSYVELSTLQGVNQMFILEVWLMARSANGLVLYNGQSQGDFVELVWIDGFLHYNFNLGGPSNKSGTVSIRSNTRLPLGEWHRVVISRKRKEGTMQINDEPAITDTAKGNLNELNLDEPFYLGGIGERKRKSNQTTVPFNGAIQKITLNGQLLQNILSRASKILNVQSYKGPPCSHETICLNGGTCLPWLNNYICQCLAEYHGSNCEHSLETRIKPLVDGQFPQIDYSVTKFPLSIQQNIIEITFRTKAENGLMVWSGKNLRLVADYFAIAIADGFLEFSFDLGKQNQFLAIRSLTRVDDGEVHHTLVTRHKQIGIMQMDDKFMSSAVAEKGATDLNTDGKLWIGGYSPLPSGLPGAFYTPWQGCLISVRVDGIALDLSNLNNDLNKC